MPTEAHFMVRCDAPGCEVVLEQPDGKVLFATLDEATDEADAQDWLVTHQDRDDSERPKTYCPTHWHRVFGARQPYWGRRLDRRRHGGER